MNDYHIVIWQEGEWWVAKCLDNSIASQGENQAEAKKNLEEALALSQEDESADLIKPRFIRNISIETLSLAA